LTQVPLITTTKANPEEVNELIDRVEAALEGVPGGIAVVALLVMVVLLQKPDISPEALQDVIREASRLISTTLADIVPEGEPIPASMLN
jgi:hypothetical protein